MLNTVPGSVLWLVAANHLVKDNLGARRHGAASPPNAWYSQRRLRGRSI